MPVRLSFDALLDKNALLNGRTASRKQKSRLPGNRGKRLDFGHRVAPHDFNNSGVKASAAAERMG
jgi:hypothetical protein